MIGYPETHLYKKEVAERLVAAFADEQAENQRVREKQEWGRSLSLGRGDAPSHS